MASDEPEFIIVGEKVALGALRHDLAGAYARWMNQLEVRRGLDYRGIATSQSQETWVEDNAKRSADMEPQVVEFTVYNRSDCTLSAPPGCLASPTPMGPPSSQSLSASAAARDSGLRPHGSCSTTHSTCCNCAT
jgi:hypothetical protein